jgi:hypothetical protein
MIAGGCGAQAFTSRDKCNERRFGYHSPGGVDKWCLNLPFAKPQGPPGIGRSQRKIQVTDYYSILLCVVVDIQSIPFLYYEN